MLLIYHYIALDCCDFIVALAASLIQYWIALTFIVLERRYDDRHYQQCNNDDNERSGDNLGDGAVCVGTNSIRHVIFVIFVNAQLIPSLFG